VAGKEYVLFALKLAALVAATLSAVSLERRRGQLALPTELYLFDTGYVS
jgi:hypothetical protein